MRQRPKYIVYFLSVCLLVIGCALVPVQVYAQEAPKTDTATNAVVSDVNQSVSSGKDAPVPEQTPIPTSSLPATPVNPQPTVATNANFIGKSILLPPDQLASIRKAMAAYRERIKNGGSEDDYLSQITQNTKGGVQPKPKSLVYFYPQFYLESLIFHSSNNWTISVNGRKFSSEDKPDAADNKQANGSDALDDIRVIKIDHEQVVLEWEPDNMMRVKASWAAASQSKVQVDFETNKVIFALRLNQTFSSYLMEVVEGKVIPVQSDGEIATPAESSSTPVKEEDKSKKGLNSLMDSYKKLEDK